MRASRFSRADTSLEWWYKKLERWHKKRSRNCRGTDHIEDLVNLQALRAQSGGLDQLQTAVFTSDHSTGPGSGGAVKHNRLRVRMAKLCAKYTS